MRKARFIKEIIQISKEKLSRIKTHEEILDLLKEIELIEAKIRNPEEKEPSYDECFSEEIEFVDVTAESINQNKKTGESIGELEFFEILSNPELSKKIQENENRNKFTERINDKNQVKTLKNNIIPKKSTFNLSIDNNGNLVGLNVKPKIKPKFKQKKVSTKSNDQGSGEKLSIIKRVIGLFSRIRLKTSSEEGSSKISDVLIKIKSIFSRS